MAKRDGDDDFSWSYYWAVDLPGMTEEQARTLVRIGKERGYGLTATAIDPREWFTMTLDRETAKALCDGLRNLEPDDVYLNLREAIEDWLHASSKWAGNE